MSQACKYCSPFRVILEEYLYHWLLSAFLEILMSLGLLALFTFSRLLHGVCQELAEWYFQDGGAILAACCHLAVDNTEVQTLAHWHGPTVCTHLDFHLLSYRGSIQKTHS